MTMLDLGKKLLCEITEAGYEAYIVGGAVRDIVMGKTDVHDVDIATNMPIEKIKEAYHTVEYGGGEKHGTVIVVYNGTSFELTQFRCDGIYTDGRRPNSVMFIDDFKTDCSRRDFTINAMGMDSSGSFVDFFNGTEDIQSGIIKTVGYAHNRFNEDALRMIRACRFAARYNFQIHPDSLQAIKMLKSNIRCVSKERVLDEFKKSVSYGGIAFAKFITYMYATGLLDEVLEKNFKGNIRIIIEALKRIDSKDLNTNLCILFIDCEAKVIKDTLKISNENYEAIKYVNDNYFRYVNMNACSLIKKIQMRLDKNFDILTNVVKAYGDWTLGHTVTFNSIFKMQEAYAQHSLISERLLTKIKPGYNFGIYKNALLERHLQDYVDIGKIKTKEEIFERVDDFLKGYHIFG